jgi:hypothetical protein
MSNFARAIKPFVDAELQAAHAFEVAGDAQRSFAHLERAHVLGQLSTWQHVRVHWQMLRWGLRQRQLREVLGQILRIGGAASKTALGWVPAGNTGGSNISPLRALPVDPELAQHIARARTAHSP